MKLKNVRKEIKIVQNRLEMSQAQKFQHKNWENHALKLPKRVFFKPKFFGFSDRFGVKKANIFYILT
ncbi:hypothetical protein OK344_13015 [Kaistella sp. BT6-1-3]|uniref:Uncharacterized protein n=1 Tax=Kaistella yananensis TaxID=2989820 RepID=A0ABT3JQS6_9FLAO|nr:hypothetical protein [Kaistella yananensis]MCW4453124.1 hypothetical protein [Kaistella yananensis]